MNTYLDGEGGVFMEKSYTKIYTTGATVPLKIRPGHFATNHAHINYYIDVTTLKARTKEAEEVAQALVGMYLYDTVIRDKHVMILMASVTTGRTLNKAVESIQYYGGILQGASAIFSAMDSLDGVPIKSVFGKKDLPDYTYSDYRDCPLCKAGKKIDALVNTFGYSPMG